MAMTPTRSYTDAYLFRPDAAFVRLVKGDIEVWEHAMNVNASFLPSRSWPKDAYYRDLSRGNELEKNTGCCPHLVHMRMTIKHFIAGTHFGQAAGGSMAVYVVVAR
jgi:hypothetical protein